MHSIILQLYKFFPAPGAQESRRKSRLDNRKLYKAVKNPSEKHENKRIKAEKGSVEIAGELIEVETSPELSTNDRREEITPCPKQNKA